jgi:hypothetical protein
VPLHAFALTNIRFGLPVLFWSLTAIITSVTRMQGLAYCSTTLHHRLHPWRIFVSSLFQLSPDQSACSRPLLQEKRTTSFEPSSPPIPVYDIWLESRTLPDGNRLIPGALRPLSRKNLRLAIQLLEGEVFTFVCPSSLIAVKRGSSLRHADGLLVVLQSYTNQCLNVS